MFFPTETLEEEIESNHPEFKGNRTAVFQAAFQLDEYQELLTCFQNCSGISAKDATKASQVLCAIYGALSRKIHGTKTADDYQSSEDEVDIDVQALSLPEARMLECVAKHLNMPYRLLHEDSGRFGSIDSSREGN